MARAPLILSQEAELQVSSVWEAFHSMLQDAKCESNIYNSLKSNPHLIQTKKTFFYCCFFIDPIILNYVILLLDKVGDIQISYIINQKV